MLINVFGHWINPDNITNIEGVLMSHIYFDSMCLNESGDVFYNSITIDDRRPDEVAAEISKQIYLAQQPKPIKLHSDE